MQVEGCPQPVQATAIQQKYTARKTSKDTSLVTVAGNLGPANLLRQKLQFQGHWQQHPKFGIQLACVESRLVDDDPATRALLEITGQISGIGQVKAEALTKAFGENLVQVKWPNYPPTDCPHAWDQTGTRVKLVINLRL